MLALHPVRSTVYFALIVPSDRAHPYGLGTSPCTRRRSQFPNGLTASFVSTSVNPSATWIQRPSSLSSPVCVSMSANGRQFRGNTPTGSTCFDRYSLPVRRPRRIATRQDPCYDSVSTYTRQCLIWREFAFGKAPTFCPLRSTIVGTALSNSEDPRPISASKPMMKHRTRIICALWRSCWT